MTQEWFDTILDADTQLFVDPFLIFRERTGFWALAHDDIISHFDRVFSLIAENPNPNSLSYRKALGLLNFREPHELCLGYTAHGTKGAGSGQGHALGIAEAISDAIKRGLIHPRHFEELGVLSEGIGKDRISDITCTILKARIVEYTRGIALSHGIKLERHIVYASGFDTDRQRWIHSQVETPTNPSKGGPLLLIPRRFLRDLPVLNAQDWWNFYEENQALRDDLNYEILGKVDKKTIIETARRNPELVRNWTAERETAPVDAYDFSRDPEGVWKWDGTTRSYVQDHPLVIPPATDEETFQAVITTIMNQFKLFIEEQGGWYLLWDRHPVEKPELAAQLLFRGIAQSYCRANDISLDAEVNLGRGPVDFKFSTGYTQRTHLEVKKLHNGKFWNGLEKQLPSYMKSDEVRNGWFLAIRYREGVGADDRTRELPARVRTLANERELDLRYSLVDARPKESASRL